MPGTIPSAARVAVRLRASVSRLTRRLRRGASADALASAKWSVLAALHRLGPLSGTGLAQAEGVKPQTLTRLLLELEAAGLIARSADARDARRSVIALAPAGRRRLAAEVHRREAALGAALRRCLAPDERAALLAACALIDRVSDALGAGALDVG